MNCRTSRSTPTTLNTHKGEWTTYWKPSYAGLGLKTCQWRKCTTCLRNWPNWWSTTSAPKATSKIQAKTVSSETPQRSSITDLNDVVIHVQETCETWWFGWHCSNAEPKTFLAKNNNKINLYQMLSGRLIRCISLPLLKWHPPQQEQNSDLNSSFCTTCLNYILFVQLIWD